MPASCVASTSCSRVRLSKRLSVGWASPRTDPPHSARSGFLSVRSCQPPKGPSAAPCRSGARRVARKLPQLLAAGRSPPPGGPLACDAVLLEEGGVLGAAHELDETSGLLLGGLRQLPGSDFGYETSPLSRSQTRTGELSLRQPPLCQLRRGDLFLEHGNSLAGFRLPVRPTLAARSGSAPSSTADRRFVSTVEPLLCVDARQAPCVPSSSRCRAACISRCRDRLATRRHQRLAIRLTHGGSLKRSTDFRSRMTIGSPTWQPRRTQAERRFARARVESRQRIRERPIVQETGRIAVCLRRATGCLRRWTSPRE